MKVLPATLLLLTALISPLWASPAFAGMILGPDLRAIPDASPEDAGNFNLVPVGAPRFETLGPIQFAGINVTTAAHSTNFFEAVGDAWAALPGAIASIPTKTNQSFSDSTADRYYNFAVGYSQVGVPGFGFMPSVEVTSFDGVPDDISCIALASQTYAVFTYIGLAQGFGDFRFSVTETYFSTSGILRVDVPNLEVYAPDYDPTSPTARAELWVAVVPEPSAGSLALIGCLIMGSFYIGLQRLVLSAGH